MLTKDVTNPTSGAPGPRDYAQLAREMADRLAGYAENPEHPDLVGHPEGNPITVRPAFPSAPEWTQRLVDGVNQNQAHYAAGVLSPRASFKAKALANKGAWTAGVQKAVAGDAFAKAMANVDEDMAIHLASTVGAQSYATGVSARKDKIQKKAEKLVPLMAAAIATVRNMPANTEGDRDNRMLAMAKALRLVGQQLNG